ncbi:DUF6624 domain-containing protein [Undibacterium sp. TJN19]|uniref:DUF6624 domain-containing protein n=1 Tax=Undibacterium sp. TJN19 TaxID=3413055 RepID=UPI003BF37B41
MLLLLMSPWALCQAHDSCAIDRLNPQLEQVFQRDQGLRMARIQADYDQKFAPSAEHEANQAKVLEELRAGDRENDATIKNIISNCGWPDAKTLTYLANSALFFVIQHGSKEDRIRYFPYFEKQYQDKQLHSSRYTMMKDRMLFDQGLPQLYATQFFPGKEGIEAYGNVEEPEKLNDRREQAGLSRIKAFDDQYPPQQRK